MAIAKSVISFPREFKMFTMLKKIRPGRTKTKRLGSGASVESSHGQVSRESSEQQPGGIQSYLELLQLLFIDPGKESSAVPDCLPENHPGLQKQPTQTGISVLAWDMFMNDPRRLSDLLEVKPDHHISYNPSSVNALFQATFMDSPSFGEISEKGDAWIISIETPQELERLKCRLCTQTSILGISIARRVGKWQTSHTVPCLMMIDPSDDSTRQHFTNAFNQAFQSIENGKNFSLDINLNHCVESWCESTLGTRCQSLGARIVITNGEPYLPAFSKDRLLGCILCFPLWGVQTCLYQLQRKSVYDDYRINPTIDVNLYDSGWVKQERRFTKDDDDDVIIMSYGSKSRDTRAQKPSNDSEANPNANTEKGQHGNFRTKKRKNKRKSNISTGQHNSGFEVDKSDSSTSITTDVQHVHEVKDSITSVPKKKHVNGVITSEMILADNVELVRFAEIDDRHLIREMEKQRGNKIVIPVESRVDFRSSTDSGILNVDDQDMPDGDVCQTQVHGVGSSSSNSQYTLLQTRFLRTGSQVHLNLSDTDSMSSSPQRSSSSPADSQSPNGVLKNRRLKKNRFFFKPKGILKENRKSSDTIAGNGMDEFERSDRGPIERPSSAIPSQRHSVRFDDEQSQNVGRNSGKSRDDQQSTLSCQTKPDDCLPGKTDLFQEPIKVQSTHLHASDKISNVNEMKTISHDNCNSPTSTAVADGMLTNAWSFGQALQSSAPKSNTSLPKPIAASTPKSFLRPKAKVVFSTDEEDNDIDGSYASRLINVNGSTKGDRVLDSMDLEKDTETDTEISLFKLEDVSDQEVNYLSDSHISVTASQAITKKQHNKARIRRRPSNPRKYQSANLPRKRLYNPKKQTISMLDLKA